MISLLSLSFAHTHSSHYSQRNMSEDHEDWASAFLSIPLPAMDYLGSFSYDDSDIDLDSIFTEIDADSKKTTSVDVGNTAVEISEPEPVATEAKTMEEERLIDYKGFEDYDDQDWSVFFPNDPCPNPNPNEPVPGSRKPVFNERNLSSSGTRLNPVILDDDEAIVSRSASHATSSEAKRKSILHWSTTDQEHSEGFLDMGFLEGYYEGNNWNTLSTIYEPPMKVARLTTD